MSLLAMSSSSSTDEMDDAIRKATLRSALRIWAPDWPRRVTRHQLWADTLDEAAAQLLNCENNPRDSPFISTYSFPRGHTNDNNIPHINTLFIDFDFEDGDYNGNGNEDAWRRDLSHLLVRVRMVAQQIAETGRPGWRAALSGHKGVHLFLDFPTLDADIAPFEQYVRGMNEYASELVDMLSAKTGLDTLSDYVDVTSSDLGRLCRAPNTVHEGATTSLGERRYCVPVTIDELRSIDVDQYIELTSSPRPPPRTSREPNERVTEILSQYIAEATTGQTRQYSSSTVDRSLVSEYRERSNDAVSLSDVKFLTSDRPCVWRFHERDDKYRHGFQSHYMEMFCIRELLEKNVPIDVIKEFLDSAPEYDEAYSENRIEEIISRDYKRFRIDSILQNAPEFCGYDDCELCQSVLQD